MLPLAVGWHAEAEGAIALRIKSWRIEMLFTQIERDCRSGKLRNEEFRSCLRNMEPRTTQTEASGGPKGMF